MPKSLKIIMIGFSAVLLSACASSPHYDTSANARNQARSSSTTSPNSSVYQKLSHQYQRWKGTPYHIGGLDQHGIDCSGFVYVTFRDAFGMKVPRSTESLATQGTLIKRQSLAVGDLVFFITGRSKRHVGIYIGNQQFIHASTSSGVRKSSLTNPYWIDHYWKSVRYLED